MLSIVTGVIGLSVASIILVLMRKDHLHVQHGVGWVIVASGFALLGFSPEVIDYAAKSIGIGYPPVLGLTIGIALMVVKILLMDIEHSRIEVRNQRLVQRVALLEADLHAIKDDLQV
jgi:hypothetical protein